MSLSVNVRQIVFVMETPLTSWDVKRLGFATMRDQGIAVQVLDIGSLAMPEVRTHYREIPTATEGANVHVVTSFRQFHRHVRGLGKDTVVLWMSGYDRFTVLIMMLMVSHAGVRWGGMALSVAGTHAVQLQRSYWQIWHSRLSRLRLRLIGNFIFRKLVISTAVRPFDMFLLGCRFNRGRLYNTDDRTQILELATFDYSTAMTEMESVVTRPRRIVFLDDYHPFHPDFVSMGVRFTDSEIDDYFHKMDVYFGLLEKKYGVEVCIAAHPRSNNWAAHPGRWRHREVISGQTNGLVAASLACVAISSTAINFAVIHRKPLFLVTMDALEAGFPYREISKHQAMKLSRPLHALDALAAIPENTWGLDIDEQVYAAYEDECIKFASAPADPIWVTFLRAMGLPGTVVAVPGELIPKLGTG